MWMVLSASCTRYIMSAAGLIMAFFLMSGQPKEFPACLYQSIFTIPYHTLCMAPLIFTLGQTLSAQRSVREATSARPPPEAIVARPIPLRPRHLNVRRHFHDLTRSNRNWGSRQLNTDSGPPANPSAMPASETIPTATILPSASAIPKLSHNIHGTPHGTTDIVFIAVGSLIALILIFLAVFLLTRATWSSLSSAFKCCCGRRPKSDLFM